MGVTSMFPPSSVKPLSQYALAANIGPRKTGFGPFNGSDVALLRDNFTISTWILLGCTVQVILTLLLPRLVAAFPAVLLLAWSALDALLVCAGLRKNTYMQDVIVGKFAVAYPADGDGSTIQSQPGDNGPGAVMILGTRSNSPLGMFAPGFKEIGDRFAEMIEKLEEQKGTSGFMGMSTWIGAGERAGSNEYATFSYWRSVEDIHEWALSPLHRDAWKWWNDSLQKHPHLGIMHEIFEVPKHNGWEGIYVNYHPTGLAATTKLSTDSEKADGPKEWVNPIVDARRGVYRSSRGRMARGDPNGSSNEKVMMDPYDVINDNDKNVEGLNGLS